MMIRAMAALALLTLVLSTLVGCGTRAPKADFTATPTTGYTPLTIEFKDLSSGDITNTEWDFDGDGMIDSNARSPLYSYTYNRPGNYTVSLTVIGPNGNNTKVKTDYINVIACPGVADFISEPTTGNCSVQGGGMSCTGNATFQFTDQSTGNVTGWAWNFGDGIVGNMTGSLSTEQNPTHTYTRNGVYSVNLTITTPICENTVTKVNYISITGCPTSGSHT